MTHCHRIIQLTDLHLFADNKATLFDVNTYDSFLAVVSLLCNIMKEQSVSLIVLTGDLSQDGSAESYRHCVNALQSINCPIAWIPGNHDGEGIQAVLGHSHFSNERHFMFAPWQIILLNSQQNGEIAGYLPQDQLHFLSQQLKQHNQNTLLMLHHHILPLSTTWLDQLNLKNSDDFLSLTDEFSHVKAVVCGHVHMATHLSRHEVDYYSSPATSIQFSQHEPQFKLDAKMPGLRILDLYENGEIITSIKRVPYRVEFLPNDKVKGY